MTWRRTVTVSVIATMSLATGYYYYTRPPAPPEVVTQPVVGGDIVQTVGATGTLVAVTTVQVGTQVSGTVMTLSADFNDVVHRHQVIARLDPALFQTQVDQARANVTKSEADLDRLRLTEADAHKKFDQSQQLAAKGLLATADADTAEATYRTAAAQVRSAEATLAQARASLQQAQVSLDKTVITSPIDGIVIARNVDVGQTVAASLQAPTLFVIAADLTKMQVNANINEADVGQIRAGQAVRFRVDAFPSDEFPGTLSLVRLNPVVQQNVVTYTAVIDVPNRTLKLKPGMTATVTIRIAERRGVLCVPNAALRFRPSADMLAQLAPATPAPATPEGPGRSGGGRNTAAGAGRAPVAAEPVEAGSEEDATAGEVWLYADGRITMKHVLLGISDDANTELLGSDLREGTPVVTTVVLANATARPASATSNPLMGPQRPSGRGGR